jgi:hypothetical protein
VGSVNGDVSPAMSVVTAVRMNRFEKLAIPDVKLCGPLLDSELRSTVVAPATHETWP